MKYKKLTIEKTSNNVEIDVNKALSDGWSLNKITDDTDEFSFHFIKD